jgi:hypothetical protein
MSVSLLEVYDALVTCERLLGREGSSLLREKQSHVRAEVKEED